MKWLTLARFAYVAVAFVVPVDWRAAGLHLFAPRPVLDFGRPDVASGDFGHDISPYLFFWQAEAEVEEVKERDGARPLFRAPRPAEGEFDRIRLDTYLGMGLANLVVLFIIITTAATHHAPWSNEHSDLV